MASTKSRRLISDMSVADKPSRYSSLTGIGLKGVESRLSRQRNQFLSSIRANFGGE